ncbi:MAG: DEAD/DEAH box helicase, partial [Desulfurococcales archaeon]|nr:DEAD/DEAH box helicase [Desulfurococcales archaeon]
MLHRAVSVPRVRFRVKGWIDEELFKTITRVARYLGRREGYSLFELDPQRVRREGYTLEDVFSLLSSIEGVVEEDLEELKRVFEEYNTARVYFREDGWIGVSSKRFLRDILREGGLPLLYDRGERAYKIPPYLYGKVVSVLRNAGLRVVDEVGLLGSASLLPRRIEFRGTLRPYQEEALKAWRENGYKGIIALPTGAGKTVVAIAGIAELQVRTLVVVYTREQVRQWIQAIRRFTDAGGMVGAYYGEEKRLAPITVTTYQTAYRRLHEFAPYFSLLIFDEAHHLPAEKFRAVALGMPAPHRLGLSATIEREDGKHEEIFPLLGGVVYHTSPGELTRQGYLAAYTIIQRKVDLLPNEKKKYLELRRRYQIYARGRTFQDLL